VGGRSRKVRKQLSAVKIRSLCLTRQLVTSAHFPRVDGSVLRKSWLDGTYEPERPIEISPEVFFGPDREPIIVPSSRGGFESTGGKVPSREEFGIDDVVRLVGKDTVVDVIGESYRRVHM
jgi:F-box/leucine-rich repeat protein 10/11